MRVGWFARAVHRDEKKPYGEPHGRQYPVPPLQRIQQAEGEEQDEDRQSLVFHMYPRVDPVSSCKTGREGTVNRC